MIIYTIIFQEMELRVPKQKLALILKLSDRDPLSHDIRYIPLTIKLVRGIITAATASLTTWNEIATCLFDKSAAGFFALSTTLILSLNTLVGHDPSEGMLHLK